MTEKRITKRDRFTRLRTVVSLAAEEGLISTDEHDDLAGFIAHEVELLDKKHDAKKAPTKTQLENAGIKEDILGILDDASDEGFRATDIAGIIGITVQKASALLRQLVNDGKVERVANGKVVTFMKKA